MSYLQADEEKKLHEQLVNVRLDLRELSTKMDGIKDLSKKVDEVQDTSKEALISTRAAHKRIDKIDKIVFWVSTTAVGAVIVGVIGYVMTKK